MKKLSILLVIIICSLLSIWLWGEIILIGVDKESRMVNNEC